MAETAQARYPRAVFAVQVCVGTALSCTGRVREVSAVDKSAGKHANAVWETASRCFRVFDDVEIEARGHKYGKVREGSQACPTV